MYAGYDLVRKSSGEACLLKEEPTTAVELPYFDSHRNRRTGFYGDCNRNTNLYRDA
jgi:hypothetical protein